MPNLPTKQQLIAIMQRNVVNPIVQRFARQTVLETTGRNSGLPRLTPIGGSRTEDQFWFVSEYGEKSQYIRNIMADPTVRVRLRGRWYTGTAHLMPEDDARRRLRALPRVNSAGVLVLGDNLLTVRVDFH
ncbi:nitroreductase/quinone reductase family protein [Nocardia sp. NPDC051756]|uniref:nitroreductase/quinone reductase family protein n=1 Tax=Nocardia sp. NPDC051756 TaxID=3154751 RepID=UPI0034286403